eukprot:SAG22_NODE_444_length_10453_cov_8.586343_3_plen_138_part_00
MDSAGIMIYHDMMFTGSHRPADAGKVDDTTAAAANAVIEFELRSTIRRLARHPSIVFYSGCVSADTFSSFACASHRRLRDTLLRKYRPSELVWRRSRLDIRVCAANRRAGGPDTADLGCVTAASCVARRCEHADWLP